MALDARTRSSIYGKLVSLLGESDANALMSEFPASEADELVTKQFLRAELLATTAHVRSEMGALRSEVQSEIGALRSEVQSEIGALRSEVQSEIGALRSDMLERFHQQTVRLLSATGGMVGAGTALLATLITLQ